jgi:hypothetical protein
MTRSQKIQEANPESESDSSDHEEQAKKKEAKTKAISKPHKLRQAREESRHKKQHERRARSDDDSDDDDGEEVKVAAPPQSTPIKIRRSQTPVRKVEIEEDSLSSLTPACPKGTYKQNGLPPTSDSTNPPSSQATPTTPTYPIPLRPPT